MLDILIEVLEKKQYSHLVIRQALDKYSYLPKQSRGFIDRAAKGCIEHLLELDAMINQVSSVKVSKMKPVIRTILRMTAYQMRYMKVPAHAACNEAVKLAGMRGFRGLSKFVNGVCRALAAIAVSYDCSGSQELYYSMPSSLLSLFHQWYPDDQVTAMLEAFQNENGRHLYAHFHVNQVPEETIRSSLEEQGISVSEAPYADHCYRLDGVEKVDGLEAFCRGWIQIQDISSSLAAQCVSPAKDSCCLDICGAPGGKSVHMAEAMAQTGRVICRDLSLEKLPRMEENRLRCGLSNMTAEIWDARIPREDDAERYDYVLADVPCSGLGVIGRKPDIKYRVTETELKELVCLQREILTQAAKAVRPGGVLVYSTCTINPDENQGNVQWLLDQGGWETESLEPFLHKPVEGADPACGMLQLLPGQNTCDGFFIARLRKTTGGNLEDRH